MRMLPNVRTEIDVDAVVEAELSSWNKLLPPRWGDRALVGAEPQVVSWFTSLTKREIQVDQEEVLLARKLGRGARPLTMLGLKERLLYRGAVSLVEALTGRPDRSREAYVAFQVAPLQSEDCRYVLKTDIAAYYQYIDHERLVDEVVAQTGDDLAVTVAVDLLRQATSRRFGIPQLSDVSDVLAEVYIDPLRRHISRAGYPVWRFTDDFRVACRSYQHALEVLEVVDHGARDLGLVLNELKTSTPRRLKYEASLTAVEDRERELFTSLDVEELEEPDFGDYGNLGWVGELDRPDVLLDESDFDEGEVGSTDDTDSPAMVSDAQLAAARKVLQLWEEEEEDEETQRAEWAQVTARLLGRALRVLSIGHDTSALEHVAALLVYEPSLTPTISRYLHSCAGPHRRAARDTLDEVCRSGIVSPWQAVWVAYVAGELPKKRGGDDLPHVAWLREQLQSPYPVLRAESAMALARRGLVGADTLRNLLPLLPPSHRPTILIALAALGAETAATNAADSELDRLRVQWALESL